MTEKEGRKEELTIANKARRQREEDDHEKAKCVGNENGRDDRSSVDFEDNRDTAGFSIKIAESLGVLDLKLLEFSGVKRAHGLLL